MTKKHFDRALYKQYDQLAKNGAVRFLVERGITIIRPHSQRFGADIEYTGLDGRPATLEAEVKAVWAGGPFPYENINVLCRKTKYFKEGTDFFMLAANGQDWLFITAETILSSGIETVANRYVAVGESFYKVSKDAALFGSFISPVDNVEPLCESCNKWVGYGKTEDGTWMCLGCGYEQ